MSEKNLTIEKPLLDVTAKSLIVPADNMGFYTVGDKKFYSKYTAIIEGDKTGIHPKWNFHEHVFSKYDWSIEPEESVTELYAQRARQLREKYDYLVIYFSGGSDSTIMLETFLNNNIKVDEIFTYTTDSVNEDLIWGADKFKAMMNGNQLAEIPLIAMPYLKKIHKLYPDIKITQHDWAQDIVDSYTSDEWILRSGARYSANVLAKQEFYSSTNNFKDLHYAGKTVGHVIGTDKPSLHIKDGKYFIAFLDIHVGGGGATGFKRATWQTEELFYWQSDLPQLIAKQAHLVKNWFEANPEHKTLLDKSTDQVYAGKIKLLPLITKLVYPNWELIPQAPKTKGSTVFNGKDKWFWLGQKDTKPHKIWLDGIKTICETVDPKWITDSKNKWGDLTGCWSKFYYIGDSISEVEPGKHSV